MELLSKIVKHCSKACNAIVEEEDVFETEEKKKKD